MKAFDDLEAWRQVPPEVKLELMSRSHSQGFMTALGFVMIGSTCAVALKFVWLMWGSLLLSPIIFQLSANKAWRAIRPGTILTYLAARSAARRYAYTARANDLTLELIFPATLVRMPDANDVNEALEAAVNNNKETEVWVTLFKDTIVMMSEQIGGAKMQFAQKIDKDLLIEAKSPSGEDYAQDKEVILTSIIRGRKDLGEDDLKNRYKVTSRYPAALVVFEKRVKQKMSERLDTIAPVIAKEVDLAPVHDEDDDIFARQF